MQHEISVNISKGIDKDLQLQVASGNMDYDYYVREGKRLLAAREVIQARIALYACSVCQIRHGGISNKYYTLVDYARDLGLPPKTLSSWTLIYRNVIEKLDIPLEEVTKNVWRTASRVNDRMAWQNREDNKENNTPRRAMKYKKDLPKEKVRQMFEEESGDEPSVATEARNWTVYLRQMKNHLMKRDLSLISKANLIEMMGLMDSMSDHINDFLSGK